MLRCINSPIHSIICKYNNNIVIKYLQVLYNKKMQEKSVQEKIALNIRLYRMRKGLKQEQLAELIDMSQQHVSLLEKAQSMPKITTLMKLAEVFDVKVDDLLH